MRFQFDSWVDGIGLALAGIGILRRWIGLRQTRRIYGFTPWRLMLKMLVFMRHSQKAKFYLFLLVCGIGGAVFFAQSPKIEGVARLSHVWAWMVILSLVMFTHEAQAPVAVFLTSSGEENARLFARLRRLLAPLRCVALLDYGRMLPSEFMDTFRDNLRTRNPQTWKSVVHFLIECVPAVVMDVRPESVPVKDEAFLMLAPERAGRGAFLVGPHGECPALKANGIDPAVYTLPTVTEETLADCIVEMLHQRRPAPAFNEILSRPVVSEDWDHLPTVLAMGFVDLFDSKLLARQAEESGKDIVGLLSPCCEMNELLAGRMVELSYEFVHDPKLVILMLDGGEIVLVRATFLVEAAREIDTFHAAAPAGRFTLEDLNQPHPIQAAMNQFVAALYQRAAKRGLHSRSL